MLKKVLLFFFLFKTIYNNNENIIYTREPLKKKTDAEWVIIGAGPAGIIAVAILKDLGIPDDSIIWIDPLFKVGRLGEFYANVPGNTKNKKFVEFLETSTSMAELVQNDIDYLKSLDPEGYSILDVVITPLQKISDIFSKEVHSKVTKMTNLSFFNDIWHIETPHGIYTGRNVILATGCYPKTLEYGINEVIPLDYALDTTTLKSLIKPYDTIAVVGGSHSAVLVLKFLLEAGAKKIYNFYKGPIIYAVDMGAWTLYNTHGLKGTAAEWAKNVLEKNCPLEIERIINTEENRTKYLPLCNKIIYAVGYQMNEIPSKDESFELSFNPETGIIGPRLFGIGLAFPGTYTDPYGNKELLIGLNSFLAFALQVMPDWIKNRFSLQRIAIRKERLAKFDEFITITSL